MALYIGNWGCNPTYRNMSPFITIGSGAHRLQVAIMVMATSSPTIWSSQWAIHLHPLMKPWWWNRMNGRVSNVYGYVFWWSLDVYSIYHKNPEIRPKNPGLHRSNPSLWGWDWNPKNPTRLEWVWILRDWVLGGQRVKYTKRLGV